MIHNQPAEPPAKKVSILWRLIASTGLSLAILYLLWRLAAMGGELQNSVPINQVLGQTLWWLVSVYLATSLLSALVRAYRYRTLLLAEGSSDVPDIKSMFVVTLCRNMFVDMVPARIGEASYVIMLKRAYQLPVSATLSTLFISVVLDMIALSILMIILVALSLFSAQQSGLSFQQALFATSLIVILAGAIIYAVMPLSRWFSGLMNKSTIAILQHFGRFVLSVAESIQRVQQRELLSLTLMQSLLIRVLKYSGLYVLFMAVTIVSFPHFSDMAIHQIMPAFVTAEAAASLPLPTFMSFGSYEAGGVLAFSVLGFNVADVLMVMFVIHLISQAVDYALGGSALFAFFRMAKQQVKKDGSENNE